MNLCTNSVPVVAPDGTTAPNSTLPDGSQTPLIRHCARVDVGRSANDPFGLEARSSQNRPAAVPAT